MLSEDLFYLADGFERKHPEKGGHIFVRCVDPELIESIRARTVLREPNRTALRLAKFAAVFLRDQRRSETIDFAPPSPSRQVHTGNNVPPLIGSAELHRHTCVLVQIREIIRLENHVTELGVADPMLAAFEPRFH